MKDKAKIEVWVTKDIRFRLEQLRKEKGWTMAELLRRAVDMICKTP